MTSNLMLALVALVCGMAFSLAVSKEFEGKARIVAAIIAFVAAVAWIMGAVYGR